MCPAPLVALSNNHRGPSVGRGPDDLPGTGDCFGVGATTSKITPASRLVLPAGTELFPGESTSIAVSESNLPVRTGKAKALGGLLDPGLVLKSRVRVPSRSAFGRHPNFYLQPGSHPECRTTSKRGSRTPAPLSPGSIEKARS